ncbi:aldolase [Candidatus Woesebacteria bacterium]|nr:aldolase [Candidatus Woesebacteria bacterium]
MKILVPADVPNDMSSVYEEHYKKVTHDSGRLLLFAGDQKIEHLNDDFYGEGIPKDDADPEHLFKIASKANIGVFAAQLGLVTRYGKDYPDIPYLIKLNSKTHLVKTAQRDPLSKQLMGVSQVVEVKKNSGINIVAVGFTIYYGSEFEHIMMSEAAATIYEAHKNGLLAVIWAYPRGAAVKNEKDSHLIAGAAGATACLGADFVKVNAPKDESGSKAELLKEAVVAAGRTKLVCAGGSSKEPKAFLQELHDQIHIGGASGNATGRNIHQKPLDEAVRFTNAIYAITVEGKTAEEAVKIYEGK